MPVKRPPRTAKPFPEATEDRTALEAIIRFPLSRDFEWFGAVRLTDGTRVDSFLHTWTGRMLRVGADGAVFGFTPTGRFKVLDLEDVLWQVLPRRWEWLEFGGYVSRDVGAEPWPEDFDDAFPTSVPDPEVPAWRDSAEIPW